MKKPRLLFHNFVVTILLSLLLSLGCNRTPQPAPMQLVEQIETGPASDQVLRTIDACRRNATNELTIHDAVSPSALSTIAGQQQLCKLELYETSFTPAQLRIISQLDQLRSLRLEDLALDDESVHVFESLSNLEVLNLPQTKLTDSGLIHLLSYLPKLQLLRIGSPGITDAGVEAISKLPNLRFLHLIDVPITDNGLRCFHDSLDLESFYIDGGQESEPGIRELLNANERLHFHRNQVHVAEDANSDGH